MASLEIQEKNEQLVFLPLLDHNYSKKRPAEDADFMIVEDEQEVYISKIKMDDNIEKSDPLGNLTEQKEQIYSNRKLQFTPEYTPYDYFRYICADELLDFLVDKSNEYAFKNIPDWQTLSKNELLVAIGLYLHTGTMKMQYIHEYWSTKDYFDGLLQTCFPRIMNENRFMEIMNSLFYCKETENIVDKVQPVLDFYNKRIDQIYAPPNSDHESVLLMVGCLDYRKLSTRYKYIQLNMLVEPIGMPIKYFINHKSTIENTHVSYINDLLDIKKPGLKWSTQKYGVLAEFQGDLNVDSLEDTKVYYIEYNVNQLFSYYPIDIQDLKCHQKIGLHVFHIILMSSFYFYSCSSKGRTINLHQYRLRLIQSLTQLEHPNMEKRISRHYPIMNRLEGLKKILKCKKCNVTTSLYCSGCSTIQTVGLCVDCFKIYHDED